MAKLNGYTFDTWEGTLQAPAGRGPRLSRIRTTTRCADYAEGFVLGYTYANHVSAYTGYTVEQPGGQEALGVRVAAVNVAGLKVMKGATWLVVDWSLVWG